MASDPGGNAIAMQLLLLVLLTLVNAFFAGAEMAIVSVNKNKIKMLAEKGNKKARLIEGPVSYTHLAEVIQSKKVYKRRLW